MGDPRETHKTVTDDEITLHVTRFVKNKPNKTTVHGEELLGVTDQHGQYHDIWTVDVGTEPGPLIPGIEVWAYRTFQRVGETSFEENHYCLRLRREVGAVQIHGEWVHKFLADPGYHDESGPTILHLRFEDPA